MDVRSARCNEWKRERPRLAIHERSGGFTIRWERRPYPLRSTASDDQSFSISHAFPLLHPDPTPFRPSLRQQTHRLPLSNSVYHRSFIASREVLSSTMVVYGAEVRKKSCQSVRAHSPCRENDGIPFQYSFILKYDASLRESLNSGTTLHFDIPVDYLPAGTSV